MAAVRTDRNDEQWRGEETATEKYEIVKDNERGSEMLLGSVQTRACVASVACQIIVKTEFIICVMCRIHVIMRSMIIWSSDHMGMYARHVRYWMRGSFGAPLGGVSHGQPVERVL